MANVKETMNEYQTIVFKRLQKEIRRQNKSILEIVDGICKNEKRLSVNSGTEKSEGKGIEVKKSDSREYESVVRRCLKDVPHSDKKFNYEAVLKIAMVLHADINALFSDITPKEKVFMEAKEGHRLLFDISFDNLNEEQHEKVDEALKSITFSGDLEQFEIYPFSDKKYENDGQAYYGYTLNPTKTNGELTEFDMTIKENQMYVKMSLSTCEYEYVGQLHQYRNMIWCNAVSDKGPGIFVMKYIEHNGSIQYRRGHLVMCDYVDRNPVAQDFVICKEPIADDKKMYLRGMLKLGVADFFVKESEIKRLTEDEQEKIYDFFDRFDIRKTLDNSYQIKEAAIFQTELCNESDKERRIEYVKTLLLLKAKSTSSVSKISYGYEEYIHEAVKNDLTV